MLIDPVDAARFTLAYLIVVVVPGYALAALARPRASRIVWLALSIPCAYSMVAITGVASALLHLSYGLAGYALLAVPAVLGAAYQLWRVRGAARDEEKGNGRWAWIPAGVAVAQLIAIVLAFARDTVPAGFDVLAHVQWIDQIRQAHVFPIALMSAHLGSTDGAFYPPVFHVLSGMLLDVVPMPSYRMAVFVVMASIAFLPVALFVYTRAATGSARLAGLAALAALAFEPLPFFSLVQGLYTFLVSFLFVPMIAVTLRDGLGRGDRRAVVLAGVLSIGLFYTHPTEFVTAALLTLAIVPGLLRDLRTWLRAAGYAAVVAIILVIVAAPALVAVHHTMVGGAQAEINTVHDFTRPTHVHLISIFNVYLQWVYGRNVSYPLLIATVIGIVWCLRRRRYLGLVVATAVVATAFIDANSYNILRPFYVLSFPWALWERLTPTHYWFVLPLAAIGIDVTARYVKRLFQKKAALFIVIASSPAIVLGLLVPLDVAGARTSAYSYARHVVAPPDLGALAWLAVHAPAGSTVVNDGDTSNMGEFDAPLDAGRWMPVLGGPMPLYWRGGGGPGLLTDRYFVLTHITVTPLPKRASAYINQYNVRYVFYGSAIRPGAKRHLNLMRLLADPDLRLAYSSAASCTALGPHTTAVCPVSGSYVFAIEWA